MSDEKHEDSDSERSGSEEQPPDKSEAMIELSEQVVRASFNVVGFHPISVDDTPDMGGLPAPES
jgi:hypothetical protein